MALAESQALTLLAAHAVRPDALLLWEALYQFEARGVDPLASHVGREILADIARFAGPLMAAAQSGPFGVTQIARALGFRGGKGGNAVKSAQSLKNDERILDVRENYPHLCMLLRPEEPVPRGAQLDAVVAKLLSIKPSRVKEAVDRARTPVRREAKTRKSTAIKATIDGISKALRPSGE